MNSTQIYFVSTEYYVVRDRAQQAATAQLEELEPAGGALSVLLVRLNHLQEPPWAQLP